MPTPATVGEFIEVIRKSGLIPDAQLQSELTRLKEAPATPQNVDQLAQALVRDGVLTKFQAKQLKLGRHKRFEIAGKYRLLELLGVGGMGAVYLCEHMFMKRLVALKVLPVEKMDDPSALARFYREARAVAAMDHPNIVRAYDIDKFESMHFLVMEFVDGTSLQEIVARHGPIAPERVAQYAAQSALGLQHATDLGLVHRDIKPGNLLLERTGTIKVLDMGLARFFDQTSDNLTEKFDNNCVLGTADYLAPEQAVTNVVDVRADIYALGGTMYFALTGQSPFPDGTIASKLMAHQTREPKPITDFRSDVPDDLLEIMHVMTRKDAADRFQTPMELYDALRPWAEADLGLPPAHEMPDLCPAVMTLAGYGSGSLQNRSGVVPAPRSGGRMGPGSGTGPRSNPAGRSGATATQPKSWPARGPGSAPSGPRRPTGSQAGTATGRASHTAPLTPVRAPRADPPGRGPDHGPDDELNFPYTAPASDETADAGGVDVTILAIWAGVGILAIALAAVAYFLL